MDSSSNIKASLINKIVMMFDGADRVLLVLKHFYIFSLLVEYPSMNLQFQTEDLVLSLPDYLVLVLLKNNIHFCVIYLCTQPLHIIYSNCLCRLLIREHYVLLVTLAGRTVIFFTISFYISNIY